MMSGLYCDVCGRFDLDALRDRGRTYCTSCSKDILLRSKQEEEVTTFDKRSASEPKVIQFEDKITPVGWTDPAAPAVNVPLALQKRLLNNSIYDTTEWIKELLDDDDFMVDLEEMASLRLEQGFANYGSEMYGWSKDKRWRNIMEELADVFVYRSSE